MKKFYTLFGLILFIGFSLFMVSCNENTVEADLYGYIKGTVTDSEGNLMKGVSITTSPGTTSVTTNDDGVFDLGKVLVGDYAVTASKEKYTSKNINVSVREDQSLVMEFVLQLTPPSTVAPDEPTYVSPVNGTKNLSTQIELVWNNGKTEKGDTLFYEVILFKNGASEGDTLVRDLMDTTFIAKNLNFETNYSWKVNVSNRARYETEGKKWDFTTEIFPSNGFLFVKDTLNSRDIFSWDLQKNHLVRLTNGGGDELHPKIMPGIHSLIAYSAISNGFFSYLYNG